MVYLQKVLKRILIKDKGEGTINCKYWKMYFKLLQMSLSFMSLM